MNNSNVLEFDPEEVIIRIKPGLTADRKWNGNIDINLDAFENSDTHHDLNTSYSHHS